MKGVASGVYSPDKQKQALVAVDKIKKLAQGGDAYARQRDAKSLAVVLGKVQQAANDFFDALSDVPDEL